MMVTIIIKERTAHGYLEDRYLTSNRGFRARDEYSSFLALPEERYGVQGFEKTHYPEIVVFLSAHALNDMYLKAEAQGRALDLRNHTVQQRRTGDLEIGTRAQLQDGTPLVYAGRSPTTREPLYVMPADHGRMRFGAAKRKARKLSETTGIQWALPDREELKLLYDNRAYIGGFKQGSPWKSEDKTSYWSSSVAGAFNAIALCFADGPHPNTYYIGKSHRLNTRLVVRGLRPG